MVWWTDWRECFLHGNLSSSLSKIRTWDSCPYDACLEEGGMGTGAETDGWTDFIPRAQTVPKNCCRFTRAPGKGLDFHAMTVLLNIVMCGGPISTLILARLGLILISMMQRSHFKRGPYLILIEFSLVKFVRSVV